MESHEKQMIVEVRALRSADALAPEDREAEGTWGVTLTGHLAGRADLTEAALDVFHRVVPVSMLEDFEIEARRAGESDAQIDLGRFSRLPDPPFVNRLLEEAFGKAVRRARPDTPAEALVYEVDGGEPDDPNTVIRAAVFERGILDAARMIGEPICLTLSKAWLAEVLAAPQEGPEP